MDEPDLIILYGTNWCGGSRQVCRFFDQNFIPYTFINIDTNEEAARYVESVNRGYRSVPTILWPDGSILVEPSLGELAKKMGISLS